jgi:hypothetical protein
LFASAAPVILQSFVSTVQRRCSRRGWRPPSSPGVGVPVTRSTGFLHVDVSRISQVSRRSILYLCSAPRPRSNRRALALTVTPVLPHAGLTAEASDDDFISGLTHAASAPALLRFAFHVAIHAQGWLPAGWLAFAGRVSNPLDRYDRFQIT